MSRLALVDGDVIVYNAGFASDAAAKSIMLSKLGNDKEAYAAYVEEHGKPHEPLPYALQGVNMQIESIVNAVEADDYVIYLSHPVNFREALFPEYKQNRDPTHKPYWYEEIKTHLLERHRAVYSELGDEADDALGMAHMKAQADGRDTVLCTIDKDLNMIPGQHYNWSKNNRDKGVYVMEDPECLRLFYLQMLTGDTSDNIPGMYKKLGTKASAQWLAPIDGFDDAEDMYQYVLQVYRGDEDFVALNGKLLWIKREPGDFWTPPVKAKKKVVYG